MSCRQAAISALAAEFPEPLQLLARKLLFCASHLKCRWSLDLTVPALGASRFPQPCIAMPLPRLLQRVGAKGAAAEVARALVNRLTPSLLPPELLHTAMEHAGESQEGKQPPAAAAAAGVWQGRGGGLRVP